MSDCLFCKIIEGKIPSKKVYEDEDVVALDDIQPQAPVHVLVIPRKHVATLNDLDPKDDAVAGKSLDPRLLRELDRRAARRTWVDALLAAIAAAWFSLFPHAIMAALYQF